jgi:ELWxxDGT repeat protein
MRKKLLIDTSVDRCHPVRHRASVILASFILIALSFTAQAQLQLLKDVNTREEVYYNEYRNLVNAGSLFYYISNNELWRSNGTKEGTFKLRAFKDIRNLSVIGSNLYFSADDGVLGMEVWKTNGTAAGTVMVKDVYSGATGSTPANFTNVNGVVYFTARSAANGMELWKTNGTAAGTLIVKDIIAGTGSSNPGYLVNRNGILLFVANNGQIGYELWRTDGTAAGTFVVKDIRPAYRVSSLPQYLTNINGTVYFGAIDDTGGRELWKTDGTAAGTVRLKDIWPGSTGSGVRNLINVNGTLFFTANDGVNGNELWKSNGTAATTLLVEDLNPGSAGSDNDYPEGGTPMGNFTNVNGILYFTAAKRYSNYIYRSDGTAAGTFIIEEAPWSDCCGGTINPFPRFTYLNGKVYFYNYWLDESGYQYNLALYSMPYNGTTPAIVTTFYHSSYGGDMISYNNMLYTVMKLVADRGYMLVQSDGTEAGTKEFIDNAKNSQGSNPYDFMAGNGFMYFRAAADHYTTYTQEVWRTDGTTAGTIKLGMTNGGSPMAVAGNYLYFVSYVTEQHTWQLYRTMGTTASTVMIKQGDSAAYYSDSPIKMLNVSGRLYYITANHQLWRSDGTTAGTKMLKQFFDIQNFYAGSGRAYLVAKEDPYDSWLYRADATGAYKIELLRTGSTPEKDAAYYPSVLIGSVLYFITQDNTHGNELWRTDGSAAGTYMVKDFSTEDYLDWSIEYGFNNMIVHNNVLYITSTDDNRDMYLWKQTGPTTFEKVREVYDDVMLSHNGLLYIWGRDTRDWNGNVLEVTDGTEAGFQLLAEYTGNENGIDYGIVGNIVYFNTTGGTSIWRSDGTSCGTFTLNLGLNRPYPMQGYGTSLLFGAELTNSGIEPFIYRNINSQITSPCTIATAMTAPEEDAQMITSYPNPYTHEFTFRVAGDPAETVNVAVYSNTGLPIETYDNLETNTDYEHIGTTWPRGIYIVKISMGDKITTHTVVKK